jgi:hypothetical protein
MSSLVAERVRFKLEDTADPASREGFSAVYLVTGQSPYGIFVKETGDVRPDGTRCEGAEFFVPWQFTGWILIEEKEDASATASGARPQAASLEDDLASLEYARALPSDPADAGADDNAREARPFT